MGCMSFRGAEAVDGVDAVEAAAMLLRKASCDTLLLCGGCSFALTARVFGSSTLESNDTYPCCNAPSSAGRENETAVSDSKSAAAVCSGFQKGDSKKGGFAGGSVLTLTSKLKTHSMTLARSR